MEAEHKPAAIGMPLAGLTSYNHVDYSKIELQNLTYFSGTVYMLPS